MSAGRFDRNSERGASAILLAISAVVLLGMVAVVIDLGAARSQRATTQAAVDAASSAAAIALGEGYNDGDFTGRAACEAAVEYVTANVDGISALPGINCSSWTQSCIGVIAARELSQTVGDLEVTIVHPVTDAHALMQSGTIGAAANSITDLDGEPCDRVGVQITSSRDTLFGDVIGVAETTTDVHGVALSLRPIVERSPVSLLLVERHECDVLATNGSGGIIVTSVTDAVTGQVYEGRIAADSDGTGTNCGSKDVVEPNSTETLRADGEPGCPGEITPGTGLGCGTIEIFAPGTPGCNPPACRSGGNIAPAPEPLPEPVTRAAVDHRYNCKPVYPASFDIIGCRPTPTNGPYLDQLVAAVGASGTPPGFLSYKASYPCNVGPSATLVVPVGNWHVDCKLRVRGILRFQGGNVVFDDDVTVEGELEVNHNNAGSLSWSPGDPVDILDSSGGAAFAYFRTGLVEPKNNALLRLRNTFAYFAPGAELDGTGPVDLSAPTEGPFEDLTVWSDSTLDLRWSGGSSMGIEGVIFAPYAGITLRGSAGTTTVSAQLVAKRLDAGGSGSFTLSPKADRSVFFERTVRTEMIR